MNPKVDNYFIEGCGRCSLGGTPQCKVNSWQKEMKQLRRIILDCGLVEDLKWSVPCYTYHDCNILILSAFKEYCALSFFKGALLHDTHSILDIPGENTQAARLIRFTNLTDILEKESVLKAYIYEAIEIEKAGLRVEFKKPPEFDIPEEFQKVLSKNQNLRTAFEALTPGRQRGYVLHFSQPKQSRTRESRIEKYIPRILEGKGLHD